MTRGINQQFELWKKFMETQMFEWTRQPLLKDEKGNFIPDGKDENGFDKFKRGGLEVTRVQGALRPIQLFEYVFPKDGINFVNGKPEIAPMKGLHETLAMLNLHKSYNHLRPEVNNFAWILRKMMGLKKIPDMPDLQNKEIYQITGKFTPWETIGVYPIGIKEENTHDYIFDVGNGKQEGFYQEGL